MRLFHLLKKFILQIKTAGLTNALKEIVFFNRTMIVVEKDLMHEHDIKLDDHLDIQIIDKVNKNLIKTKFQTNIFDYYAQKGAKCLAIFNDKECLGYQWWTQDNQFKDLKKLNLTLNDHEVYLFDFFVFPKYRGTNIPKMITQETFNHLASLGLKKIYGFYFGDNIKALWWHRAVLKAKEIRKVKTHRFLFFEFIDGKIFV
jgi:hypothetical protein